MATFTNALTLSLGKIITAPNDLLETVSLKQVHALIVGEASSVLPQETARLRKLALLDKNAYRTAKTRLPYVVGGLFDKGIRRTEHFSSIQLLILDIDHLPDFDGVIPAAVTADASVAMAFVSPSGQGFKVFLGLEAPCLDTKVFQAFYKSFASQFAERMGLGGSVDLRTSDVTRACFLAHDPSAYFNPNAQPLKLYTAATELLFAETDTTEVVQELIDKKIINEVAYREVLREVSPHAPVRAVKKVQVVQELLDLQPRLEDLCQKASLEVVELLPIQYGLKVMVKQGHRKAEVNVFWGKKGFSVVKSPKTGTDATLMDLLYGVIYQFLFPPMVAENVPLETYLSTN